MNKKPISILTIFMSTLLVLGLYGTTHAGKTGIKLSDAQIEDLVRRSYQYVALYNLKV